MKSPELSNLENKPEQTLEALEGGMQQMAERTNADVGFKLLDNNGKVDVESFGGLTEAQNKFITDRETAFAHIDDPLERLRIINHYKLDKLPNNEVSQWMYKDWAEKKRTAKSTKLEMLVTLVFYKALGEDYLIMRSSDYDDYKNGVDLIIINKKTDEVIGTFDEVHDRKEGERTLEKNKKIIKQAEKGGVNVEHGARAKNGKIEKTSFSNVPNFYLLLTIDELDEALEKVDPTNLDSMSPAEEKLFTKFASAIMQQAEMLLQQATTNKILKPKLEAITDFFKKSE